MPTFRNMLPVVSTLAILSLSHAVRAQDIAPQPEPATARFRWGISAAGGPVLGGFSGGAGGIDARFGAQLNRYFAIYAQPVLLVAAGASSNASGASGTAIGLYGVAALADLTLGDLFYVAAGPELLAGGVGTASASTNGTTRKDSASTGPFFSVAARAGFAFGSQRPTRRKAFTVGLDLHTIFTGEVVVLPLLAVGFEAF
jgi:hypothetical protein